MIKTVLGGRRVGRALQRGGVPAKTRVRNETVWLDGSLGGHDSEPVAREKQGRRSS